MGRVPGLERMTGKEANTKGCKFLAGNGVALDHGAAIQCFEYASKKGNRFAQYNLGICYEGGYGVSQNNLLAAKFYILSLSDPELTADAQAKLSALPLSGYECNQIGLMYFNGDPFKRNREKAKEWFWSARGKDYNVASCNLATCFEDKNDSQFNLQQAVMFYEEAIERGYEPAKEKLRNLFQNLDFSKNLSADFGEKHFRMFKKPVIKSLTLSYVLFMNRYYPNESIHAPSANGDTILHKAAQAKTLKNCARLMLLGANHSVNNNGEPPFKFLSYSEKMKTQRLQTQVAKLNADLSTSPAEILAERTTVDGGFISKDQLVSMYSEMYRNPLISPLLDLAKLAALGLHELSSRKCVTDYYYDSDHDDEIKHAPSDLQKLSIRLSSRSDTVEYASYWDSFEHMHGTGGFGAYGVYHCSSDKNTIYIGSAPTARHDTLAIRATIIHELCHFITNEVYQNACKPFYKTDKKTASIFEQIANHIVTRHENNEVVNPILLAILKYSGDRSSELIVRVAQMVIEYPNNALEQLRQQAPALLDHYVNEFLLTVKVHKEILEERARGYWPKDLFEEENSRVVTI